MQHEPVGDDREGVALPLDLGLPDRDVVVLVRDLARDHAVALLVLEVEDRVRVVERRAQQPLGVVGRRRHDDLQPWHVREQRLHRLRVVQPAVDTGAIGGPDHDGAGEVAVGAVPQAGRLLHDLVEGRVDEVGELDLDDREQAAEGHADAMADDRGLRQRRVDHPLLAELLDEALRGPEHPTAGAHVLAHDQHALVARHEVPHGVVDGFDEALLRHDLFSFDVGGRPWGSSRRRRGAAPLLGRDTGPDPRTPPPRRVPS